MKKKKNKKLEAVKIIKQLTHVVLNPMGKTPTDTCTSQLNCTDIDLDGLKPHLQLHILSHPVGKLYSFHTKYPLPITDYLTP
jgi:hypothetical protein